MFKDVNIKQILRVMLVVLFAAFMLTACEQDDSIGGRSRAAMAAPVLTLLKTCFTSLAKSGHFF